MRTTRGRRIISFFESQLRHSKGEWAGRPLLLEPWAKRILGDVFGTLREDGQRQYRRVYTEIPRKNGKSTVAAGVALYLLMADNEAGAEVYSAASDRTQAAIVFEIAKSMVESSPLLSKELKTYRNTIVHPKSESTYKVLSAEAYSKHGFNAHGIVFDELHAQPNRDLWDVLCTSTGARRQPLVWAITTAGYDRESICWEQHEYARQIIDGVIEDPSFYPFLSAADEDDDWTSPEVWKKANPNLGISVSEEYLWQECERAKNTPSYQNTFRRLHLNQWTAQNCRAINMLHWNECGESVDEKELIGRDCYIGLDLASTTDITAAVAVFPPYEPDGDYIVDAMFWIPGDNIIEKGRKDRVDYSVWVRDGYIIATPGNVVDYDRIRAWLNEYAQGNYQIREIAYDPWNAMQLVTQLQGDGFTMVPIRQGLPSLTAPTKQMIALVESHRLNHRGNPVLRWMADNLEVTSDAAGNIKPDKSASRAKIDGMVALIMAIDRATRNAMSESVYERSEVLFL